MSLHKSNIAIQGLPVWFEVDSSVHPDNHAVVAGYAAQALGNLIEKCGPPFYRPVSRDLSPKVTLVPVPLDLLREIADFGELSAEGRVFRKLQANLRQWIDAHV
jgi:hypothetical protein